MRTDYYITVDEREFCVTIDDIEPPRPAPIAHDHDDPNFSIAPEPGHFDIVGVSVELGGKWTLISVHDEELKDSIYEAVEDELEKEGWKR